MQPRAHYKTLFRGYLPDLRTPTRHATKDRQLASCHEIPECMNEPRWSRLHDHVSSSDRPCSARNWWLIIVVQIFFCFLKGRIEEGTAIAELSREWVYYGMEIIESSIFLSSELVSQPESGVVIWGLTWVGLFGTHWGSNNGLKRSCGQLKGDWTLAFSEVVSEVRSY